MAEIVDPSSTPRITALYRYPVKGLSPEALQQVNLAEGATMPFDRAYAIENGPSRFVAEEPKHLPKIAFLMLMRDERLATLQTQFDDATQTLTIKRDGRQGKGDSARQRQEALDQLLRTAAVLRNDGNNAFTEVPLPGQFAPAGEPVRIQFAR